MQRILEPELMEDDEQARAYATADFEEAHSNFIVHFGNVFKKSDIGHFVLDLGCGPGDISLRFARAYPECVVHGIDGSEAMLRCGNRMISAATDVQHRVRLIRGFLPGAVLPRSTYDAVISNSLLHHLHDPRVLWETVRKYTVTGSPVFVMDLLRPHSVEQARTLVDTYASEEPKVLRQDFYNSLLAAFEINEIRQQLIEAGLDDFAVKRVSDRHVVVTGRAP